MLSNERELSIEQQKLASLLLRLIALSSDELGSHVKSLGSNVETLGNSSRRIESLTGILILVTIIAVFETVAVSVSMPIWGILGLFSIPVYLIIFRRNNRKFTGEGTSI